MDRILIATDGSPSAREAVRVGLELAVENDAEGTFLNVLPPDEWSVNRVGPAYPVVHRVEIDEGEKTLKEAGEAAEAAGVPYALELVAGDAVDAILEVAKAKDADLIVLGSVSQGALKRSQEPVLADRGARASVEAA